MGRRERWRKVLALEVERWSTMPFGHLVPALNDRLTYNVEFEGKRHQVQAEILESTADYVHIAISVDDGSLPASMVPVTVAGDTQLHKGKADLKSNRGAARRHRGHRRACLRAPLG